MLVDWKKDVDGCGGEINQPKACFELLLLQARLVGRLADLFYYVIDQIRLNRLLPTLGE